MVKKVEIDLSNSVLCDDTLLSPSVASLEENNKKCDTRKLDGLERARELLAGILNQLVFLDFPLNEERIEAEGDEMIRCNNNTLNNGEAALSPRHLEKRLDNLILSSGTSTMGKRKNNTAISRQIHSKPPALKSCSEGTTRIPADESIQLTVASNQTSNVVSTLETCVTTKDEECTRTKDDGMKRMGHASLVGLCSNAIESSLVINEPPTPLSPPPSSDEREVMLIQSNHPSDEELEVQTLEVPETGLLCSFMNCPNLEALFSSNFLNRGNNVLFGKIPAIMSKGAENENIMSMPSPESKNSIAAFPNVPPAVDRACSGDEEAFSNFSSLAINPSSSFSVSVLDDSPKRMQMFGSEYARFLSSTPFSPSKHRKKKSIIKSMKRFTQEHANFQANSNVLSAKNGSFNFSGPVNPPPSGSIHLEDASEHVITGAMTDLTITHGNDHPPRGFYRISKSGDGHDADLTVRAGETAIYMNVKKESNWDRAVQRPYITSLVIIFPDRQEFVPPGYCVVRHVKSKKKSDEKDDSSLPANLNHGTIGERVYLCFKRSREGNPITGIIPLQPSNGEAIPEGYTVLERTPRNYIADVNGAGAPVFLATRQRLANLETLRPIPLIACHINTPSNQMIAYYCTGATVVSSHLGKCHVMDRSRHPMISPSSVVQRLMLIQASRDPATAPTMPPPSQNYPSYDSIYHSVSSSINDCESVESSSSNLLIQSMVNDYIGRSLSTNLDSLSTSTPLALCKNAPYVDCRSAYFDFIPIITNASGNRPSDLARVLILTPVLTSCYTHHGGVARTAIESLSYLLNQTDFFDADVNNTTKEPVSFTFSDPDKPKPDSHTLLDLALQVVCDVATSTSRETMFQPCVDFVFDAIKFTHGKLNTRSLGYAFRMFLFVFYFGASMPKSSSWPFSPSSSSCDTLLLAEGGSPSIGAPQAAALALKGMVTILLSRLDLPSVEQTKPVPSSKEGIYSFVQNIVTDLVDSTISAVDVSNFTQIASHQILRSGGSELFWHEMITSCGYGLFGKKNHAYVVAFATLASIVKISSGSIRFIQHSGESIPRDVNTKLLSLELLHHFVQNCKIGQCDNQASFHSSSASILAYTIRRLVVPCLLNNTMSSLEDPRIFRRIMNIITELWMHFRFHLKMEMAVLLDHFVLRILKVGPQTGTSKQKCITLVHQLEVLSKVSIWFHNPIDILELYLNYDMDDKAGVTNWKVCQLLCNCLSTFAEKCGVIIAEQIHCTRENQIEVGDATEVQRKREAARSLQAKSLDAICKITRSLLEASYQVVYPNEDFSLFDTLTKNDSLFFSANSSVIESPSYLTDASSFHSGKNTNIYLQRTLSKQTSSGLKEKQADRKKTEESMKVAFEILEDRGLKKALDYLVACNVVTSSPRDLASFLRIHQSRIDPSILGDYLGEGGRADDGEYWNLIRYHFVRAISFAGMNAEEGLRHLLTRCGFLLPGEAQRIDRIMNTFAQCYWEDNAGDHVKCPFRHQDTIYLLSYAIIMLNTDLHKANGIHPSHVSAASSSQARSLSSKRQPKKMSKQDFISNLRGTDAEDLCKDYLTSIYDSIERNPISFLPSQRMHVPKSNNHQNHHNKSTSSSTSSIFFTSDKSCSNSSVSSVRLLTKSIKPSLELLRGLADQKHIFYSLDDDDSLYSNDFLKLIVHSVWHHFHGIVNGTLDAVQLDPQGVFSCLQILQNTICMTIILGMETEKKAFIIQLSRIKFLMERGLEDGASRVYSRSVQDANFVVGDEFKHEKWYQQIEKVCTSTNRMDAVHTVVRTVEQLKRAMPIDGNLNVAMKKVTDLIRNGGILLNNPTRSFVYDGDLIKKSSRSGRSTPYHFFLFSDVLLYAHKSSKGDHKVHESLLLYMMKISDIVVSKKQQSYGFQIHHPRKSFVAFALCSEVKKMWIDLLTSSIRQAVERKAGFEGAPLATSASCES